jgi:serine/threonine protein kinase
VLYDEIASGGMATVHYGRLLGPVGFSRTVAIKRLHPQFARDQEFVAMFVDEARLAARIRHPNVVPTLDVVATDGELFLVMDYVQGESLSRLLRASHAKGPIPIAVTSAIFCGALHGLHAAHEATDEQGNPLGLVHRDVSPQNILVGAEGIARVLDFGVAKAAGRVQTTGRGRIKGKLSYLAPEQIDGTVTRQTDLFSTAVALWEVLTGQRLFQGQEPSDVIRTILACKIEPPSKYAPDLPPGVDAVVMRALERDPQNRYATAREMAMALEGCLGLASPTQVGAWVELVAHEALARRAAIVAEIESLSARSTDWSELALGASLLPALESGVSLSPPKGLPTGEPSTAYTVRNLRAANDAVTHVSSSGRRGMRTRSYRGRWMAGTLALSLLGGLALLHIVHRPGHFASGPSRSIATAQDARTTVVATASSVVAAQAATSAASVPASVGPVAAAAPAVSSSSAGPSPARSSSALGGARPASHNAADRAVTVKARPSPAPATRPSSAPDPECDPPYALDDQGHKIWKEECFRKRSP